MPLLAREPDLYPETLLAEGALGANPEHGWWAVYTRSRQEKELMRRLRAQKIPHYGPTIHKRLTSPAGRVRSSWVPLFSNYVFVYGGDEARLAAVKTNCVSRTVRVTETAKLTADLQQVQRLISTGAPITPEDRLEAGDPVRVRTGAFAGYEGFVIKRHGETRLLIAVGFLQQGASVLLDDCHVQALL